MANQAKTQSDFDALAAAAEAAVEDAEKSQVKSQFGKLAIEPRYLKWEDGVPEECDVKEYMATAGRSRTMEIEFGIDIQEFNPDLEWTYERRVRVGSTDWWKILKPALEEIPGFENGLSKGNMAETLGKLNGSYVHAHDVLQSPTKKQPDPEYKTIKIVHVFESRDECYAEWKSIFGDSVGGGSVSVDAPPGWDETWADVSGDFYNQLSELVGAKGPQRVKGIAALAKDFVTEKDWVTSELEDLENA